MFIKKPVSFFLLALTLAACSADEPKFSLAARPADPQRQVQFDVASFAAATVAYPALATEQKSLRELQIPVGDYLISRLGSALGPTDGVVSLASFTAHCRQSELVAPHLICDATMELAVDGRRRRVTRTQADLGNAHLIHGPYEGTSEQPYIEKQAARLVDELVDPLR